MFPGSSSLKFISAFVLLCSGAPSVGSAGCEIFSRTVKLVTTGAPGVVPDFVRAEARDHRNRFRSMVADPTSPDESRLLHLPELLGHLHGQMTIYDKHGYGGDYRVPFLFSRPIDQALREGYAITNHGYFERTPRQVARRTAGIAKQIVVGVRGKTQYDVADLFAGTGRNSVAFASRKMSGKPLRVFASDHDPLTVEVLENNLRLFSEDRKRNGVHKLQIDVKTAEALETLENWAKKEITVGVIYLDVPWNGTNLRHNAHHVGALNVSMSELIRSALVVSDNLIFKLPGTFEMNSFRETARQLKLEMSSQSQNGIQTLILQRISGVNTYSVRDQSYSGIAPILQPLQRRAQ